MNESNLLSPHATKAIEYLLAVSYLLLFIPFWRFVNGATVAAAPSRFGWFQVPDGVHLHRGHSWAKTLGGAVAVGLDDFAHKLVGPLDSVELPRGRHARSARARRPSRSWPDGKPLRRRSRRSTATSSRVNEVVRAHPADARARPLRHRLAPEGRAPLAHRRTSRTSSRATRPAASSTPPPRSSPGASRLELGVVLQDGGDARARHRPRDRPGPLGRPRPAVPRGRVGGRHEITISLSGASLLALSLAAAALAGSRSRTSRRTRRSRRATDSPGVVTFRHESHVDAARPDCTTCHPALFPIVQRTEAPAAPAAIRHADMEKGKRCGSCHDGKSAHGLDDCGTCHAIPKER